MKTGVVFDTNVLISSTIWEGSVAQKLLFKLIQEDIKIFSSPELLQEYQKILKRDFGYLDGETRNIIYKVSKFLTFVNPLKKVKVIKEDPDDNKVVECAIESRARYIISYDKHLLKLKNYKDINIIRPEETFEIF